MTDIKYPHLFIPAGPEPIDYVNPSGGGGDFSLPERPDRSGQATKIRSGLDRVWEESVAESTTRKAVSLPAKNGTYIEFESSPSFDLQISSLEARASGIRLLSVRREERDGEGVVELATVYVPYGKEKILINKVEAYRTENTKNDDPEKRKPQNKNLIESIESLRTAILQSFWYDPVEFLPPVDTPVACEAWLRTAGNEREILEEFRATCHALEIECSESFLSFPERMVVLIKASTNQLTDILSSFDYLAEFRRAKETSFLWMEMDNTDKFEAAAEFADRLSVDANAVVSICVHDTGANNGHPLLTPILSHEHCLSVKPAEWGVADTNGHGTAMCGNVAFADDLGFWLESGVDAVLPYRLESVKLIPHDKYTDEQVLNGERTLQAVSRVEVANPGAKRVHCLAITSEDGRDRGRPSSWSGAIDQIISGQTDGDRRLMIVAAGNVNDPDEWKNYPESNITNAVHDPAQSWNALTVGAVTFKNKISDTALANLYEPMANVGELSPYTTTSTTWETKWPFKPDIVMEGGNVGIDNTDFTTQLDDLSLLTLGHMPQDSMLDTNYATSAATALASEMAGRILSQYPDAWPETIRGLMVHSAEWTTQIWDQFSDPLKTEKANQNTLLRICGYGTPDRIRALASAKNSLTLVAEQNIQPFFLKDGKASGCKAKDMHLYELPWPTEALKALPENTDVIIDVTLSYFVEPGPGEIGWRDKYRYRSHGLDFNLKKPTESKDEFLARLNKSSRLDEATDYGGGSVNWVVGSQSRNKGSIHRDWVKMPAVEAADANLIGIFPRTGWWKERAYLGSAEKQARYSLIVSIRVPEVDIDVDIYSPVAVQIAPEIAIKT
jgi:hypothetical protein